MFILPKPYDSWHLDEDYNWQAPIAKPDGEYYWDEDTQNWKEINLPEA